MKTSNESIGRDMRNISNSLAGILEDAEIRDEISFNLAEVKSEMSEFSDLLDAASEKGKITEEQWERICYIAGIHWPYHFEELKNLLVKED